MAARARRSVEQSSSPRILARLLQDPLGGAGDPGSPPEHGDGALQQAVARGDRPGELVDRGLAREIELPACGVPGAQDLPQRGVESPQELPDLGLTQGIALVVPEGVGDPALFEQGDRPAALRSPAGADDVDVVCVAGNLHSSSLPGSRRRAAELMQ